MIISQDLIHKMRFVFLVCKKKVNNLVKDTYIFVIFLKKDNKCVSFNFKVPKNLHYLLKSFMIRWAKLTVYSFYVPEANSLSADAEHWHFCEPTKAQCCQK
jgi:hypothetical protein